MKFNKLKPALTTPLAKSLTLHVAILLLLIFGANISFKRKTVELSVSTEQAVETNPAPVEAVAIDRKQLEQRVAEIQKNRDDAKKAEEDRIAALERRAKQAERNRAAEEERLKRVAEQKRQADEAARKSKAAAAEAQKQQQAEAAKAKQAEEARKAREAEQKKAEAAAKAAEERRRLAAEAEAKEQAERERKAREAREQAERERQLQEQMAKEAEARRQARAQQAVTEVQRYTAMIRDAIQRNLLVDENMRGKTARINIRLASSGFVTDVRYVSGDRQVADAAIRAVNRAGTLPVSTDPDVYNQLKDITLTVAPEF
ncbi:Cell division and transport-associated protein TolA [Arsukibacterium tuosuense]|uniref:Cell division and transport-associated protein TolA n=1 Tax=Arsukibacterium tuosuense TaxID=1323745 RepID=A0A285IE98_9GAMM|nr:cell envelope integrity protein TolA [Arsukibacterium tuosuense]SNY45396.1 Cell division and transport-associated protein TolA [Arsukibacterium tuosuense]